jgi:two-component system OmpR family response regulator
MTPAPHPEPVRRILVVDDDTALREQVCAYLGDHGFEMHAAPSAAAMDQVLGHTEVDVLILDVMLPGEDGLSVCRRLAETGGPAIIMMSAMGEEVDRVLGLELGADDYLPKPCSPRELLARVRALIRRMDDAGAAKRGRAFQFLGFQVDGARRQVRAPNGAIILLTAGEFALLNVFLEDPQRVLSREQLLEQARGSESQVFDRAVDVQISRLRRKLNAFTDEEVIRTLRGAGYMLDVKVTRA